MKLCIVLLIVLIIQVISHAHRLGGAKKRLRFFKKLEKVEDVNVESSMVSPTSNFFSFKKLRQAFFPQRRCDISCIVTADYTSITTSTENVTKLTTSIPLATVTVTNLTTSTSMMALPATQFITKSTTETRTLQTTSTASVMKSIILTRTAETTYSQVSTVTSRTTQITKHLPAERLDITEDARVNRPVIEATRTQYVNLATMRLGNFGRNEENHYFYTMDYDHFIGDGWFNDMINPIDYEVQYFRPLEPLIRKSAKPNRPK